MTNTRSFSESIQLDLEASPEFRNALLVEAVSALVVGDLQTGKVVLREYVNGTLGFQALGSALGHSPKSLMRMLSPQGNPQAANLLAIVAHLQKVDGTRLAVHAISAA